MSEIKNEIHGKLRFNSLALNKFQANWFKLSTELMTQVKTRQIQQRMRKQSNKSSVENSDSLANQCTVNKKVESLNSSKENKKNK